MAPHINGFFEHDVAEFTRQLAELETKLGDAAVPRLDETFQQLSDAIGRSRDACRVIEEKLRGEPLLLKEVQARFRDEIRPWFDASWFMQRARTKPRGYPGDYELLSAIYDAKPKHTGIGGCLDLYFLHTDLGRAVRARMQAVRQFLVEEIGRRTGDVSILNVACGPCREYVHADELNARPGEREVHVTCVDADRQALDFVQSNVASAAPTGLDMRCVYYNALRMSSARANVEKFGRCDIIYSVGLCDYIPDKYLVPMLRGLRETLNEDGVVYIAFKDTRCYDHTEYQWHVDWHFFQRTESDCRDLFERAGYDMDAMDTTRDETGVIVNFIWRNVTSDVVRLDAAEREVPAQPLGGVVTPANRTAT